MSLSDELRDPWGLLVAGVSGGMAWALLPLGAAALPVGLGVGAAVLGVKAVSGVLLDRGPAPARRPARGSAAAGWLARAEAAVEALEQLAPGAPAVLGVGRAVEEAAATRDAVARLGARSIDLDDALRRVDGAALEQEAEDLRRAADRAPSEAVAADLRRSAAAVADRLAVRDRMRDARTTLLTRMQAAALGLESLVARLSELVLLTATADGVGDPAARAAELAGELEGLRAGLAEAEALSKGVLG